MARYIRTFYNGDKVIMKLSGCQVCPLMRFNMIDVKCTCRYFSSSDKRNVVNHFVIDYNDKGAVYEKTMPPPWCGLPTELAGLAKYRTTFTAYYTSILINGSDDCDDNTLDIIDAEELRNREDVELDKFLTKLYCKPYNPKDSTFSPEDYVDGEGGNDTNSVHNNLQSAISYMNRERDYGYQTKIEKYKICSSCGKEKEFVKRDENMGMCNVCWDLYKDDESKKKQAFINNFRLKRDKNFLKTDDIKTL